MFWMQKAWGIAFFEYCLQVPANRIGSAALSLPQLKVIQEVLALLAFVVLYRYLWEGSLNWNHAAAGGCLVGAVFFVFRELGTGLGSQNPHLITPEAPGLEGGDWSSRNRPELGH